MSCRCIFLFFVCPFSFCFGKQNRNQTSLNSSRAPDYDLYSVRCPAIRERPFIFYCSFFSLHPSPFLSPVVRCPHSVQIVFSGRLEFLGFCMPDFAVMQQGEFIPFKTGFRLVFFFRFFLFSFIYLFFFLWFFVSPLLHLRGKEASLLFFTLLFRTGSCVLVSAIG